MGRWWLLPRGVRYSLGHRLYTAHHMFSAPFQCINLLLLLVNDLIQLVNDIFLMGKLCLNIR